MSRGDHHPNGGMPIPQDIDRLQIQSLLMHACQRFGEAQICITGVNAVYMTISDQKPLVGCEGTTGKTKGRSAANAVSTANEVLELFRLGLGMPCQSILQSSRKV